MIVQFEIKAHPIQQIFGILGQGPKIIETLGTATLDLTLLARNKSRHAYSAASRTNLMSSDSLCAH